MSTLTAELFNRLQNLIDLPRTPHEEVLARVLNSLPEQLFTEMINFRLSAVTPDMVRTFARNHFERMDVRPNPPDGVITIDEVAEAIGRSKDPQEQATILFIWLNFENIRKANEDFHGEEKLFDNVLTREDFERYY